MERYAILAILIISALYHLYKMVKAVTNPNDE